MTNVKSVFNELNKINVNNFTEKKGTFTYLSWAWAVRELLQVSPDATWEIHEWGLEGNRQPYMKTEAGCFVKVTVTVNNIERTQVHPVLDHRNKTIEEPDAFQINTSIQRCLAKAIGLHGLGLYLYAGEDLPTPPKPITKKEGAELLLIASKISDNKVSEISKMIDSGAINESNYRGALMKLERLSNE